MDTSSSPASAEQLDCTIAVAPAPIESQHIVSSKEARALLTNRRNTLEWNRDAAENNFNRVKKSTSYKDQISNASFEIQKIEWSILALREKIAKPCLRQVSANPLRFEPIPADMLPLFQEQLSQDLLQREQDLAAALEHLHELENPPTLAQMNREIQEINLQLRTLFDAVD